MIAMSEDPNDSKKDPRRPWFGPKRIGWGLRPQTWQGWTIVNAGAVVVILAAKFGLQ
jgi:hypothetical protein